MAEHAAVAAALKKQAEAQLETNAPRAAAIASLAIVSVLIDIAESLHEVSEEIHAIGRDVCPRGDHDDH